MHAPLLPAGVPRGLRWLRSRIAAWTSGVPLLFFAVVLGVAAIFRIGVGAVRAPGADADEPPAVHGSTLPTLPIAPATVDAPGRAVAPSAVAPAPRHKPRAHGRR